MRWDLHIYNPRTKKTRTISRDYPNTTRSDQGAVGRLAEREYGGKILAVPSSRAGEVKSFFIEHEGGASSYSAFGCDGSGDVVMVYGPTTRERARELAKKHWPGAREK